MSRQVESTKAISTLRASVLLHVALSSPSCKDQDAVHLSKGEVCVCLCAMILVKESQIRHLNECTNTTKKIILSFM